MKQFIVLQMEQDGEDKLTELDIQDSLLKQTIQLENNTLKTFSLTGDRINELQAAVLEIKSKDIFFLNNSIVTIRKDLLTLIERQDKIVKKQSQYFEKRFLELSNIVISNQKNQERILNLIEYVNH